MNSDVVASTHDGALVMVKYRRKIQAFSQLCYNHGIHLAVLNVLYRKKMQLIHISAEDSYVNEDFKMTMTILIKMRILDTLIYLFLIPI